MNKKIILFLFIILILAFSFSLKFVYSRGHHHHYHHGHGGDAAFGAIVGTTAVVGMAAAAQSGESSDSASATSATTAEILKSEFLKLNDKINEVNSKLERLFDKIVTPNKGVGKNDKKILFELKEGTESVIDEIDSLKKDQNILNKQIKDLSNKLKKLEK